MSAELSINTLRFDLDHDLAPLKKCRSPTFSLFSRKSTQIFDTYIRETVAGGWSCCCEAVIGIGCAYFCKNCARYTDALICAKCFKPEEHEGHSYRVRVDRNFMCECGNPDAWKTSFCGKHALPESLETRISKANPEAISSLREVVGCILSGMRKCITATSNTRDAKALSSAIACLSFNLLQMATCGEISQRIVAETVCEGQDAILQFMMDHERNAKVINPWTGDFKRLHTLSTKLMPDGYFKMHFARGLVRNYNDICDARCKTGGVGKDLVSFMQLSQRFFTVPRICIELLDPKHFGDRSMHILHFIVIGLLQSAIVMKKRKSNTARRPFELIRPYAKLVEQCFDNLNDILQSDVQLVRAFLSDAFLIKVYCQTLLIFQEVTVIDSNMYDDPDSMFRDVFFMLNRSIQETIKTVLQAIPGLEALGFVWDPQTKMPAPCDIDADPFLSKIVPSVTKQIEKGSSPFTQIFESDERFENFAAMCKPTGTGDLPGYQLLFGWAFAFLLRHAPRHDSSIETYTLPFHRTFARLASAVASRFAVPIAQLVPAGVTTEQMRIACEGPMNIQQTAAFDHDIPNSCLPGSDAMPLYDMSSLSEYDVIFVQIAVCYSGPQVFEETLPMSPTDDEQDSDSERVRYLQLMVVLGTRGEVSALEHYERTVMRCLMTETQKYTDFFVAHRTRYDLCSEDGAVEYSDLGMSRERSFRKHAKRINATDPAMYTLRDEFHDRLSIYDADVALDDLSALVIAAAEGSSVKLLPPPPPEGAFAATFLALHGRFQVNYAMTEITRFARKEIQCEETLRIALDFLISGLRTYPRFRGALEALKARTDLSQEDKRLYDLGLVDIVEDYYMAIESDSFDSPAFIETLHALATAPFASALLRKVDELLGALHEHEVHCDFDPDAFDPECVDVAALKAKSMRILAARRLAPIADSRIQTLEAQLAATSLPRTPPAPPKTLEAEFQLTRATLTCAVCKKGARAAGALGLVVHTAFSSALHELHADKYPPNAREWCERSPHYLQSVVCPPDGTMHLSTCGHAVHDECRRKMLVLQRRLKQNAAKNVHALAVGDEFICPACSTVAGGVLPLPAGANHAVDLLQPGGTAPSGALIDLPIGLCPRAFPGRLGALAETFLDWLHAQKARQPPLQLWGLATQDIRSLDDAIRVFATQVALLELQSRLDAGSVTPAKLFLLRSLLELIHVFVRSIDPQSGELAAFLAVQRALDALFRGRALPHGLHMADVDPFSLLVQLVARFVLCGDARANVYRRLREIVARMAWQGAGAPAGVAVFIRQSTLLDMLVRPGEYALAGIGTALDATPADFGGIFADAPIQLFPGGSRAHRPPLLSDSIAMPHFGKMPRNFLETLLERCREQCGSCMEMAYRRGMCMRCWAMVCICEHCCPRECSRHSLECGGGTGLYVEIGEFSTRVLYQNALTNQCAFLQSPWIDEHGETDIGCVRGKPLLKCPARARRLHLAWLEGRLLQATEMHTEKAWVWNDKRL